MTHPLSYNPSNRIQKIGGKYMLRNESIIMLHQLRKEGKSISSISSISRYTETHKGWTHSEYRDYALSISENNPMRKKKRETKEMDCRRKVAIEC
jgi:hypothetical protein